MSSVISDSLSVLSKENKDNFYNFRRQFSCWITSLELVYDLESLLVLSVKEFIIKITFGQEKERNWHCKEINCILEVFQKRTAYPRLIITRVVQRQHARLTVW